MLNHIWLSFSATNVIFQNVWFVAATWMALALIASLISIRIGISVALIEIFIGVVAGYRGYFERIRANAVCAKVFQPTKDAMHAWGQRYRQRLGVLSVEDTDESS